MPFESQAQRRWMYANHPAMAKRWEAVTPKGEKLPEHVKTQSREKVAFPTGFMGLAASVFEKHPAVVLGLGGAILQGHAQKRLNAMTRMYGSQEQNEELDKHPIRNSPLTQAAIGGAVGAVIGHGVHRVRNALYNIDHPVPTWLNGVKTKAEAKARYHQVARTLHPDVGGNEDMFKNLGDQWESFKEFHFHKLANFLPALTDELEKISAT